jgi:hypothetical protein
MGNTDIEREKEADSRRIVCAVELGWRIAYFYSDLKHPMHDAHGEVSVPPCLPAVETLPNSDQVELHVRAAARLASRLNLDSQANAIAELAAAAYAAAKRPEQRADVRERIGALHKSLIKELWATREGEGKAYELGSSLFDTWNRMRLAATQGDARTLDEWHAVFRKERIERIKVLLDDLQTRLDPAAVEVVKDHLDRWHKRVMHVLKTDATKPLLDDRALAELRKQALIWRQLVTRDKEPEAYLQRKQRARVRHEFNGLMWRSLIRWPTFVGALICAGVVFALYRKVLDPSEMKRTLLPILGALGVTQASLIVVARDRLNVWAGLLWNRALTKVVFDVTCGADAAFSTGGKTGAVARPAKAAVRRLQGRPWGAVGSPIESGAES